MPDQPNIDIALITVLPEEYQAVRRFLADVQDIPGSAERPNIYAWARGQIPRADGNGAYAVVLGMSGFAGTVPGALIARNAVEYWRPKYLLLVGIAGGFGIDNLRTGDVVISEMVYYYEYGKLEQEFQPRNTRTFRVDTGLLNSAIRFRLSNPTWSSQLASSDAPLPKAIHGIIASGDKVVDNPDNAFFVRVRQAYPRLLAVEMEGAGAAAAIAEVVSQGMAVGFLMVRGISDMPRSDIGGEVRGTAERDAWKERAATAAACFTVAWIASGLPVPPQQTVDRSSLLSEVMTPTVVTPSATIPVPSISRSFTERDRDVFQREGFLVIKEYFQQALEAMKANNAAIQADYTEIHAQKFICTVYLNGKLANQCKIWYGGGLFSSGINYIADRGISIDNDNTRNGSLTIEHQSGQIGFQISGIGSIGSGVPRDRLLNPHEAAEFFWRRFIALIR